MGSLGKRCCSDLRVPPYDLLAQRLRERARVALEELGLGELNRALLEEVCASGTRVD